MYGQNFESIRFIIIFLSTIPREINWHFEKDFHLYLLYFKGLGVIRSFCYQQSLYKSFCYQHSLYKSWSLIAEYVYLLRCLVNPSYTCLLRYICVCTTPTMHTYTLFRSYAYKTLIKVPGGQLIIWYYQQSERDPYAQTLGHDDQIRSIFVQTIYR